MKKKIIKKNQENQVKRIDQQVKNKGQQEQIADKKVFCIILKRDQEEN